MMLPSHCLRGIPNKDCIIEDGLYDSTLFQFQQKDKDQVESIEESINWLDDEDAIPFTFNQKKPDGSIHFKGGVGVMDRNALDALCNRIKGYLEYERKPVEGNKYHGNILLKPNTPIRIKKMIAHQLAFLVHPLPKPQ